MSHIYFWLMCTFHWSMYYFMVMVVFTYFRIPLNSVPSYLMQLSWVFFFSYRFWPQNFLLNTRLLHFWYISWNLTYETIQSFSLVYYLKQFILSSIYVLRQGIRVSWTSLYTPQKIVVKSVCSACDSCWVILGDWE